jgi:glutamate formiminotransferase/formiminotetrahydrofolate cyclodeaminase
VQDGGSRFRDLTLAEFVDRLASAEPVPGGGSAAAVAASLGAALVAMVASLSIDREKYRQHSANLRDAAVSGRALAARLLELADDDARAYAAYAAAMKLPRESGTERKARTEAVARTGRLAAEVPLETLRACLDVASLAERLAGRSNVNASSDLSVAALLAAAAATAAAANVFVNLPAVNDLEWTERMERTTADLQEAVEDVARMAREAAGRREPRPPVDAGSNEATEVRP